jgi:hypothetical protein
MLQATESLRTVAWTISGKGMQKLAQDYVKDGGILKIKFELVGQEAISLRCLKKREQKTMYVWKAVPIKKNSVHDIELCYSNLIRRVLQASDPFLLSHVVDILRGNQEYGDLALRHLRAFWGTWPAIRSTVKAKANTLSLMAKDSRTSSLKHKRKRSNLVVTPHEETSHEESPCNEVFKFKIDFLKGEDNDNGYPYLLSAFSLVSLKKLPSLVDLLHLTHQVWVKVIEDIDSEDSEECESLKRIQQVCNICTVGFADFHESDNATFVSQFEDGLSWIKSGGKTGQKERAHAACRSIASNLMGKMLRLLDGEIPQNLRRGDFLMFAFALDLVITVGANNSFSIDDKLIIQFNQLGLMTCICSKHVIKRKPLNVNIAAVLPKFGASIHGVSGYGSCFYECVNLATYVDEVVMRHQVAEEIGLDQLIALKQEANAFAPASTQSLRTRRSDEFDENGTYTLETGLVLDTLANLKIAALTKGSEKTVKKCLWADSFAFDVVARLLRLTIFALDINGNQYVQVCVTSSAAH